MRIAAGVVMAFVCSAALATEPVQRTLSFDDRVKAQGAIERVYYSHQIGTTKPFAEAVPRAVLENQVRKYLEQSAALDAYWTTAVTDYTLQRELERMAQGTKMPERLLELYAALGNDPFLIKECLARPALVDRLTHNFYAFDSTKHVKERGQAEALHAQLASGALSPSTEHPNRTVSELVGGEAEAGPAEGEPPFKQRLPLEEFLRRRAELPTTVGQVSDIRENRESYVVNVILSETTTNVRVASYVVPKTTWDAWWETARRTVRSESVMAVASGIVDVPVPDHAGPFDPLATCANHRWDNGSLDDIPDARVQHTAVWTGNEMLIWGGVEDPVLLAIGLNTGARYDPATDTWSSMTATGAPVGRRFHTAVWTGSRMVVWGGTSAPQPVGLDTGGSYDPQTNSWMPTTRLGAPSPRNGHIAVWTGSRMVVWGGNPTNNSSPLGTGGRYEPLTDSWTPTSLANAPSPRNGHSAVWTGSVVVVWGGNPTGMSNSLLNTGGRYDPATDGWMSTSLASAPSARSGHTAVWAGGVMIVWGGYGVVSASGTNPHFGQLNTGARYDPSTDTWATTSATNAPIPRYYFSAVSTGSGMLVWGGGSWYENDDLNTGARYDPATDRWTPTATIGAPEARRLLTAVWTGDQVIVWGGYSLDSQRALNTGGRYDPTTDRWTLTARSNGPPGRVEHTAVWTGTQMVVWGGLVGYWPFHYLNDGARYDPTIDSWTQTSTMDAPSPREGHSAVWTGSLMVIWGGFAGDYDYLNTGGRYDPATDSWAPTSTTDAPPPRRAHTAVWTGNRLVVWGGYGLCGNGGGCNSGGRYDPATDTWLPTSTIDAPLWRHDHGAVWAGSVMVVWGGLHHDTPNYQTIYYNTGGRYDPTTDSWTPTSMTGAPSGRWGASCVWTGSLMVVWGGSCQSGSPCDIGGRYDPIADQWTPVSTAGAPSTLGSYSAVWTGSLVLHWGSIRLSNFFWGKAGGQYDPSADSWTPFPVLADEPSVRGGHTAVWTGNSMVVWGGYDPRWGEYLDDGGRFSPGELIDDDCDGDGFTSSAGDCDDHDPSLFPGAPQICDGRNNDCADPAWPSVPVDEVDLDHDGFRLCNADCDESRVTVWPGAPQLCDGVNNDCNDPAWPNPAADEIDEDRDGARLCHGDCNDTDRRVGPGFWEYCDGVDNDCTGAADDGPVLLNCDDANPCTDEVCGGAAGCTHTNNVSLCDDHNGCTTPDVCGDGACLGTPADGLACSDDDFCTTGDTCTDGQCISGTQVDCDDGNACNGPEWCSDRYGCVVQPADCDDENPCTDDACDTAVGCIYTNNSSSCVDWNICTTGDTCVDGHCTGGSGQLDCDDGDPCNGLESCYPWGGCYADAPLACDDRNPCTDDACEVGSGCVFAGNSELCDDGSPCTVGDSCNGGTCVGVSIVCNDHNPCTTDTCDPQVGCVSNNNTNSCSDGNACTTGDVCVDGWCHPGALATCNDNNDCTTDACSPSTGCVFDNNANACDDGNACTVDESCVGGVCHGPATACSDGNPCTDDSCDPASGCVHVPSYYGTPCDDQNVCDGVEYCDGYGTCVSEYPPQCDDLVVCTLDSCDPGLGCVYEPYPAGTSCGDGDACNGIESCDGNGLCEPGHALDCDDLSLCSQDYCDSASGCQHVPYPAGTSCSDGNPCNGTEVCTGAIGCPRGLPLICDDNNPCTNDTCDPATGCVFANNMNACDDGNACTQSDACSSGACVGGSPVVCGAVDQCHLAGACDPATGVCSNPLKSNGTVCDDTSLCTTGETCQSGTCTPASSGLNEANPRTNGYYKRLCHGPHSGDQLTDADATCVASVALTFAGITTIADLCAELQPSQPNNDACDKAEDDLIVLALNICRARVCTAQGIDSQCGGNVSVSQSLAEADAILSSASRNGATCAHAKCLAEEINTGRALELNSLLLSRQGSGVRLNWSPPYLDDGSGHPSKYHVWRRAYGSLALFIKVAVTTETTFLDPASGGGSFEYEVTAVMGH